MAGHSDEQPPLIGGWKRHALIITSTAPAFLLLAIFFALRWLLIGGDRAESFADTAILFTLVGAALLIANVALRRQQNT